MTTSQAWPIAIGRITFKDRRGPVTDVRRKKAIRTFAKLSSSIGLSVKIDEKGAGN